MKKRSKKLLVLAMVIGASPAQAAVPYAKIVGLQLAFDAMPVGQRDKLELRVSVVHVDHADHTPVRMWVLDGDKRIELAVGADGRLPETANADWARRGLQAETDQKPHTVTVQDDLLIRPPAGVLTIAYLRDAAAQAQQAMIAGARQVGGYLATFAAPSVRSVKLTLAGCCTGTVRLGGLMLMQDKAGAVVIPKTTLETAAAGEIAVSAPIVRIDPDTE